MKSYWKFSLYRYWAFFVMLPLFLWVISFVNSGFFSLYFLAILVAQIWARSYALGRVEELRAKYNQAYLGDDNDVVNYFTARISVTCYVIGGVGFLIYNLISEREYRADSLEFSLWLGAASLLIMVIASYYTWKKYRKYHQNPPNGLN